MSSIQLPKVGGDGVKGLERGNRYFAHCDITLLENLKIWCKIQVIIYPLIYPKINIFIIKEKFNKIFKQ